MAENGYDLAALGDDLTNSKVAASSSRKSSGAAGRWICHQSWTTRICSRASGENSILTDFTDPISRGVPPVLPGPGCLCPPKNPFANDRALRAAAPDLYHQGRPPRPQASGQRPCLLVGPQARGVQGDHPSRLLAVRVSRGKVTTEAARKDLDREGVCGATLKDPRRSTSLAMCRSGGEHRGKKRWRYQ